MIGVLGRLSTDVMGANKVNVFNRCKLNFTFKN